jgi:hypothetical protein
MEMSLPGYLHFIFGIFEIPFRSGATSHESICRLRQQAHQRSRVVYLLDSPTRPDFYHFKRKASETMSRPSIVMKLSISNNAQEPNGSLSPQLRDQNDRRWSPIVLAITPKNKPSGSVAIRRQWPGIQPVQMEPQLGVAPASQSQKGRPASKRIISQIPASRRQSAERRCWGNGHKMQQIIYK